MTDTLLSARRSAFFLMKSATGESASSPGRWSRAWWVALVLTGSGTSFGCQMIAGIQDVTLARSGGGSGGNSDGSGAVFGGGAVSGGDTANGGAWPGSGGWGGSGTTAGTGAAFGSGATSGSGGTGGAGPSESDGPCVTPSSPVCQEKTGVVVNGMCVYAPVVGATCNDGNACTTKDTCQLGDCIGTPVVCEQPPPTCLADGKTLHRLREPVQCSGSGCSAPTFVDDNCPFGCLDGACQVQIAPVRISSGASFNCAVVSTGGVKCWGTNQAGRLGSGAGADSPTPVDVVGLTSPIKVVSAGQNFACALDSVGGLKCWGYNSSGQLGNKSFTSSPVPVDVVGLTSGVIAVSAGKDHVCAVTAPGALKCWGNNSSGILGDGTTSTRNVPTDVVAFPSGVRNVAVGPSHSCVLTELQGVKCWGSNGLGQLGDGTLHDSVAPVDVVGLTSGVRAISVGNDHSCAITVSGALQCWGWNGSGQIDRRQSSSSIAQPFAISGFGSDTVAVGAGNQYTCASTLSSINCWGINDSWQLGHAALTGPVVGLPSDVSIVELATGAAHVCSISSANDVWCWGSNSSGQLGPDVATKTSVSPIKQFAL